MSRCCNHPLRHHRHRCNTLDHSSHDDDDMMTCASDPSLLHDDAGDDGGDSCCHRHPHDDDSAGAGRDAVDMPVVSPGVSSVTRSAERAAVSCKPVHSIVDIVVDCAKWSISRTIMESVRCIWGEDQVLLTG